MTREEQARQKRAVARAGVMVLRKGRLGHPEVDFTPITGAAAISLATRLTIESFSIAGMDLVDRPRADGPFRFVPRTRA